MVRNVQKTLEEVVKMATSDARADLYETLMRVAFGNERILLTKHEKNVAAIVPVIDLQLLLALNEYIDLETARTALKETGKLDLKLLMKKGK